MTLQNFRDTYKFIDQAIQQDGQGGHYVKFGDKIFNGTLPECEACLYCWQMAFRRDEMELTLETVPFFDLHEADDVRRLFSWMICTQHLGLGFHPDTPFGEYCNYENGDDLYSAEQSDMLDKKMEEAFDLCRLLDLDIYEIGLDIMTAYAADQPTELVSL